MSTFVRSLITVLVFSSFIALWISAWRKSNTVYYDAAARLPLEDDTDASSLTTQSASGSTTG